ncbi:hypothetical protein FE783_13565 [Paenibacillus mesophilus]|uniref:hypothetical protein n=1 Tax=Paenibacillus mesophilus TaxID=2582849 RepID=UPI00110F295A|nr:hypothetical protein [Paenibacillus mesophilus]TMV49527.1 hypothetical protein FE783_13565 [Paenibacillus mesophilus]
MKHERFETIDVEKLNIVDKDGTIKMTLFNRDHIPPAMMDGEDILPGHRKDWPISGIMFYNGEGDECGGLIFGSEKKENGEYTSSAALTFDQYKQDEVVTMSYDNQNGVSTYGFKIKDRPKTPLPEQIKRLQQIRESDMDEAAKQKEIQALWEGSTQRAYMGKNEKGEVLVCLMDKKGKPRLRMLVDEHDNPRMEFLDGQGNVLYKLPPEV